MKIFAGALERTDGKIRVMLMPADVARAVVDVAHAAGKPAFAHVSDIASVNLAVDSAVDALAHTTTADDG